MPKKTRPCAPPRESARRVVEEGSAYGGRMQYDKYLAGVPITRTEAMRAKCYECMNGFTDGQQDCEVYSCPIYPWQPFRKTPLLPA